MAQLSQTEIRSEWEIFESQIRECYGRVVYSHKTHEKCADICLKKLNTIKFLQILFSVITSGSLLITVIGDKKIATVIGAIFSALLLFLSLYNKNYNLGEEAQKHRETANKLWNIREFYLSLLTDILSQTINLDELKIKRNQLQSELVAIYDGAPPTNYKAYKKAQKALKKLEDMTFSNDEIDQFLPEKLRKKKA